MSCDKSSVDEWISLGLSRLRERMREGNVADDDSPYSKGSWTAAYQICGEVKSLAQNEFLEILGDLELPNSGWPPFWISSRRSIAPYPYYEDFECWLYEGEQDPAHSDFWRASPQGRMFLLRGYYEDSIEGKEPGTFIDIIFPIRQTAEIFLHATELFNRISLTTNAEIIFQFEWSGLNNRQLGALDPRRYMSIERISRQPTARSRIVVDASSINTDLVNLVYNTTSNLFHAFQMFELSSDVIREFIDRMMGWPKRKQLVL